MTSTGRFLLWNGAWNSLGLSHCGRPACVPAVAPAEQPSPQLIPVVIYSFALKGPLPAPYVLLFILQDLAQCHRLVGPSLTAPQATGGDGCAPEGFQSDLEAWDRFGPVKMGRVPAREGPHAKGQTWETARF